MVVWLVTFKLCQLKKHYINCFDKYSILRAFVVWFCVVLNNSFYVDSTFCISLEISDVFNLVIAIIPPLLQLNGKIN